MSCNKRIVWAGLSLLLLSTGHAQVTTRVSVGTAGVEGMGHSSPGSISADGRYVAFDSPDPFFAPLDFNNNSDVFVHDRQSGTTECVSVDPAGAPGNAGGFYPSISADGRFVAFCSSSFNLVPGDTNGVTDIFVRDRLSGTTERVSLDSAGTQGNDESYFRPSISADGRYVAFQSWASNLVAGDTNGVTDVFVCDRLTGTTECVSLDSAGSQANSESRDAAISGDGRYVAFSSFASDLVAGDTNGFMEVFVRDRLTGTTERVGVDSAGTQGNNESWAPSISADGRYVVFGSRASNLVAGDTNGLGDVFVRDRQTGTTERVSVDSTGTQGNGESYIGSISDDGRYLAFDSFASNLVPGDTNELADVFIRDRQTGTTERVSLDSGGAQGDGDSIWPGIATGGRYVVFLSIASNLVPWDRNNSQDVFLHDRQLVAPAFTSRCEPAFSGVIACPCSNPPAGTERGCDNSAASGGASLAASGNTQLSADGLVFTTSGETTSALSVVVQGNAFLPAGAVYGQGVRCLGGMLLRLYTKTAAGGAIRAPDRNGGDLPVSVRSAYKGDMIQAGQSRWYLVFYRDPIVLGGCPAASTFNATQTGEVIWSP